MTRAAVTRARLRICLAVALTAAPAWADAQANVDVPYLTGRVVDNAGLMDAGTRDRVTERVAQHEQATGNQIVVLTVPTIGAASIEDYAAEVFQGWKLGQQGKDNGVLVVVVPQDRKMRIEVGYGLEPTLTDIACAQIIRNVMTPQFKAGSYDRGIEEGVNAVLGQLEGTGTIPDATAAEASSSENLMEGPDIPWPMRILLGAFIFGIIGLFTVVGVMTPGVGWFLYLFLIPFWAMFPILVVGVHGTMALLATYVVGYPIAKIILGRKDWYKKAAADLKKKGTARIGGFTLSSSGGSSRSSSGWSSGGSSFSGGGGSSGGGGASGSW